MSFTDQQRYQVRAEWGVAGLRRLAPSHVVVIVDALGLAPVIAAGEGAVPEHLGDLAAAAADAGAVVLAGGFTNAQAVAQAIIDLQNLRGERTFVAVIAAGAAEPDGLRFAVENQLAAGAVIAALGDLGTDHTSPEAAVFGESYRALAHAAKHLVLASPAGREMSEAGHREHVTAAASLNSVGVVPALSGGTFTRFAESV